VGTPLLADQRFRYSTDRYDAWITLGKFIARECPHQTLASGAIGKIPFFSEAYTLDMLGLVDPVIAHQPVTLKSFLPGHGKFDADYTLSQRPDLVLAWIQEDGNLYFWCSKAKYQAAGYRLKYLLYTERRPPSTTARSAVRSSGPAPPLSVETLATHYRGSHT
jgi:arabinofuranosyltransferase